MIIAVRRLAALAAVAALTLALALTPAGSVHASTTLHVRNNYHYGHRHHEVLNAYWHDSSKPLPGLIVLHGGYWTEGTMWNWVNWSKWAAGQGFQVFNIDYELAGVDSGWPTQRDDAEDAIKWIRHYAGHFSVDPDRLVMLGSSAGGQIATAVATYGCGSCRVKGVVGLSAPSSPYRAYWDGRASDASESVRRLGDSAVLLARCSPRKDDTACWNTWRDMVVHNRVSDNDAPMLLTHFQDDLVPAAHSYDLQKAEARHDVPVTVQILPGTGHATDAFHVSGEQTKIMNWLKARVR